MMRYEEALAKHQAVAPLDDYERGLVDAIYAFSWMKDGIHWVGSGVYTLGDAIDRKLTEYRERKGLAEPVPEDPDERARLLVPDGIERPRSCPEVGQVPAFDAGWEAHKDGMGRDTVASVTAPSGRDWALMGYDVRALLAKAQKVAV